MSASELPVPKLDDAVKFRIPCTFGELSSFFCAKAMYAPNCNVWLPRILVTLSRYVYVGLALFHGKYPVSCASAPFAPPSYAVFPVRLMEGSFPPNPLLKMEPLANPAGK